MADRPTHAPLSTRGIPLVLCGGRPGWGGGLVTLTVESYIKWYDVYGVTRAGRAGPLGHRFRRLYEALHPGEVAWGDHIPTPGFCFWLEDAHPGRLEWDPVALDLVAGRWASGGRPDPHLWDRRRERRGQRRPPDTAG